MGKTSQLPRYLSRLFRGDMDWGDWGVGEIGRRAPNFTHPIYSPMPCHFDAAHAAGEIYSIISPQWRNFPDGSGSRTCGTSLNISSLCPKFLGNSWKDTDPLQKSFRNV